MRRRRTQVAMAAVVVVLAVVAGAALVVRHRHGAHVAGEGAAAPAASATPGIYEVDGVQYPDPDPDVSFTLDGRNSRRGPTPWAPSCR